MTKEELFLYLQQLINGKFLCETPKQCTSCPHAKKTDCKIHYALETIINAVLFKLERPDIDDALNEKLKNMVSPTD